jgi:hypothetical protein
MVIFIQINNTKMINAIFIFLMLCNSKATSCKELFKYNLKISIYDAVGKNKYDELIRDNKNILTFKIELDSTGRVNGIKIMKNNCLPDSLAVKVCDNLKTQKYCIYNGDPNLTYDEFIRYSDNKINYILPIGILRK